MSKRYAKYNQDSLERIGWEHTDSDTDADAFEPADKEHPQVALTVHEQETPKGRYEYGFRGLTFWGRHPISPAMALDALAEWGEAE